MELVWMIVILIVVMTTEGSQEIRVVTKYNDVVLGRSFEYRETPFLTPFLVTEPLGTQHAAAKTFSFTSHHKVIRNTVKYNGTLLNVTFDGVNSAGLSASLHWFDNYARFVEEDEIKEDGYSYTKPYVSQGELVLYILCHYSSVSQAKEAITSGTFPAVWADTFPGLGKIDGHYNLVDLTGDSLVIEHTSRGVQYYPNTMGVLTNSPSFSWHMDNLKVYPAMTRRNGPGFEYSHEGQEYTRRPSWLGSGTTGLPGDYTSPSRFIKAATLLSLVPVPTNLEEAIIQVSHLLNSADIPYGLIETDDKEPSYTWYTLIKDLANQCVYYRDYSHLRVKRVCLEGVPEVPAGIQIEDGFLGSIQDMTSQLTPLNPPHPEMARNNTGHFQPSVLSLVLSVMIRFYL